MIGLVLSVARDASGATVAVSTPSGATDVHLDAVPDRDGATRVQRTLRHCSFVRLTCEGGRWTSRVHGFGHHRPTALPISLATALGLFDQGLPCVMNVA